MLKGGGGDSSFGGVTVWANPRSGSFDSFPAAMLLLYIMSTGDDWEADMYAMMDATPAGESSVHSNMPPCQTWNMQQLLCSDPLPASKRFVSCFVLP